MLVLADQTFPAELGSAWPGRPIRPEPLPGMKFALNANMVIHVGRAMGAIDARGRPTPDAYVATAKAFYEHTSLRIDTGSAYEVPTPKATPYIFELDLENIDDFAQPDYMLPVVTALRTYNSAIRLACFSPTQIGVSDDNWLKREDYVPSEAQLDRARDYLKVHDAWLDRLYCVQATIYPSSDPAHEQVTLWYMRNYCRLMRQLYPARRIALTVHSSGREVMDQRMASVLRECDADPAIGLWAVLVWGLRDANRALLRACGVWG